MVGAAGTSVAALVKVRPVPTVAADSDRRLAGAMPISPNGSVIHGTGPSAQLVVLRRRRRCGNTFSCSRNIVSRSEEHTSELQSLMRISYAVFCLTKKKKRQIKN